MKNYGKSFPTIHFSYRNVMCKVTNSLHTYGSSVGNLFAWPWFICKYTENQLFNLIFSFSNYQTVIIRNKILKKSHIWLSSKSAQLIPTQDPSVAELQITQKCPWKLSWSPQVQLYKPQFQYIKLEKTNKRNTSCTINFDGYKEQYKATNQQSRKKHKIPKHFKLSQQ